MKFLTENKVHCMDARDALPRIRPGSVALSFWSPPYFVGKSYERDMTFPQWKALLAEVVGAHARILKPGGFMAVNIADILCFRDPAMPRFQASKPGARRSPVTREDILAVLKKRPQSTRVQLAAALNCSEQTIQRRLEDNNVRGGRQAPGTKILLVGGMLQKWGEKAGLYLYDHRVWVKDPCWQNCQWHSSSYRAVDEFEHIFVFWKPGITEVDRSRLSDGEWGEWGSRGVWRIPSVRVNDDHDAKFPLELPRRAVRLLTDPGDLVLDPFIGSGTTALAAQAEGRRHMGVELERKHADMAQKRVAVAGVMAA